MASTDTKTERAYCDPSDLPPDLESRATPPGEFPFLRGPYPGMYTARPWTIRQYAGFATAEETNERFRYLLAKGQTGLSVAFDLPTQLGLDSDDSRAVGEVGRTGVAIDSLDDMRRLFKDIPLTDVSTSMTINAPASILLLMYYMVAEEQVVGAGRRIRGTVQNDILKEYVARGNYIFPPRESMRLTTDTFAWCADNAPDFNTISISGYHIREAGSTAAQEIAFTLAHGAAYVQAAVDAGLDVDVFAPRLSFFFNAHNDFFIEVAKFRAARELWARIMHDDFGARSQKSMALRFHAQTGGSTLTAQQPQNNVVRVAIQAFAAACGGAQSIHTNSYDEALALPTAESASIALRTQQVLQHESGITRSADPLGGSWYVEKLTADLIDGANSYMEKIKAQGGAVAAVESTWTRRQIDDAAYEWQRRLENHEQIVVGVNDFLDSGDDSVEIELQTIDPRIEHEQVARLTEWKSSRDQTALQDALSAVRDCAFSEKNLLEPMRVAIAAGATVGEICGVLREAWGEWRSTS